MRLVGVLSRYRRIFFFYLPVLLLVAAMPLSARGRSEGDPLVIAREYIDQKKFSSALLVLADVIENDKDEFEAAQKLVDEVFAAKYEVSEKRKDILTLMEEDAEPEEIYTEIQVLKSMDKEPDDEMRRAIARIEFLAGEIVERREMNRLMDTAYALLQERKYWEAIDIYRAGVNTGLGSAALDSGRLGLSDLEDRNTRAVPGNVDALIGAIIAKKDPIDGSYSALTELTGDPADVSAAVTTFAENYEELANAHQAISETAKTIGTQVATLQGKQAEGLPITFLSYLQTFITGRTSRFDELGPEGLLHALNAMGEFRTAEIFEKLAERHRREFVAADASYEMDEEATDEMFEASDIWAKSVIAAGRLVTAKSDEVPIEVPQYIGIDVVQRIGSELILADLNNSIINAYQVMGEEQNALQALNTSLESVSDGYDYDAAQVTLISSRDSLSALLADWRSRLDGYERISISGLQIQDTIGAVRRLNGRIESILGIAGSAGIEIAQVKAERAFVPIISSLREQQEAIAEGVVFYEGEDEPGQDEVDADKRIRRYYPSRALPYFVSAREELEQLMIEATEIVDELAANESFATDGSPIKGLLETGEGLISDIGWELAVLLEGVDGNPGLEPDARARKGAAERAEREGNSFLQNARNALNTTDFDTADTALKLASERFQESLALEYDAELASRVNAEISQIQDQIGDGRKRVVETDVLELLESGKSYYREREYDRASVDLTRARNLWREAFGGAYPTVEYWYALVTSALSVEIGRSLREVDPLYPEMRSLLNFARGGYEDAKKLFSENATDTNGIRILNEALDRVARVLDNFSQNEEARILELEILRLLDADKAEEKLSELYQEASEFINTNEPAAAYNILLAISKIEDNYRRTPALLFELEGVLGIRQPVIADTSIQDSRNITAQAKQIIDARNTARFADAKASLERALELWPDNEEAQSLFIRLLRDDPTPLKKQMTPAELALYNKSLDFYEKGDYTTAWYYIEKLWADAANRRNLQIISLRENIDARRGG